MPVARERRGGQGSGAELEACCGEVPEAAGDADGRVVDVVHVTAVVDEAELVCADWGQVGGS